MYNLCDVFIQCYIAYRKLEKCGWKDNNLKREYYMLLNSIIGRKVVGIQTGYEYEIMGVAESKKYNLPGLIVRRLKDDHIGFVLCHNLEEV